MCFGAPKMPPQPKPPSPTPPPFPQRPTDASLAADATERRRRLAAMKFGMASTIKTGAEGDTSSVNLLMPAIMGAGLKTNLGQ